MEVVTQIIKQLPPFWPRLAVLLVLLLVLALPHSRHFFRGALTGSQRLERAKSLLQARKLQIEVDVLRAANPELEDSVLDRQIERMLPQTVEEDAEPALAWPERLKLAAAGALGFAVLGMLVLIFGGRWEAGELLTRTLKELLVIIPCALLASAIPARARWVSVFTGFLMPVLIVALALTARMHDDSTTPKNGQATPSAAALTTVLRAWPLSPASAPVQGKREGE